ncbi:MAG: zinc-ribbon domain-containing protein [Clostridia bacterium]|nr:zinc-ribbon domain-containing protein [Clostridia bacterium]
MKVCKNCGEINTGDSAFCCNCGKTNFIFQEEIRCSHCGEVNDKSFAHCINCGEMLAIPADAGEYVAEVKQTEYQDADLASVSNEVANLYGGSVTPSETAQCPKCGASIPLTAIFCNKCGTSVADLHARRVVQRKVCPHCGRVNTLESHYCSYCYCSLAEASTEELQVVHESQNLGEVVVRQAFLESPNEKKLICPNCGTLNNQEEPFCVNCGLKLEIDEPKTYCPNCGAENSVDSTFCTKCRWSFSNIEPDSVEKWTCKECGFSNEKDDKFCSHCGQKRKK